MLEPTSHAAIISNAIAELEQRNINLQHALADMTADRDLWKQSSGMYENENNTLKKEINRARGKADYFMRRYEALKAGLGAVGSYILDLTREAQTTNFGASKLMGEPPAFIRRNPTKPRELLNS